MSKDLEKKPLKYGYYNTIKCTKVEWLWYPYIPYGKITIIQGDPGEGKSTFAMNLTALLTNGGETPFTKVRIEPSTVVYQNSEDGKEDTIVPRLNACGADLKRVAYIDEYDSSLAMDDSRLDKVLEETAELKEVFDSDNKDKIEDELGDLLFSVVNVARFCDCNAESALERATMKFMRRYTKVERLAEEKNIDMKTSSIETLDKLWESVKMLED